MTSVVSFISNIYVNYFKLLVSNYTSANSGVWVLDWIDMEHLFDPDNLYGTVG
jgi:hypothetical protein